MSAERLYQHIDPAGVAAIPPVASSEPPPPPPPPAGYRRVPWPADAQQALDAAEPSGRTWLEAATAIPGPAWLAATRSAGPAPGRNPCFVIPARRPYVRVYRTGQDPDDPELGPCWHWRCQHCRMQSGGCAHTVLHKPGTWPAAMCGGLHHIHTEHPRRPETQGEHPHTTLRGRRRCDWTRPTEDQLTVAILTLCGRTGYPRGPLAREVAREVLALDGRRTP